MERTITNRLEKVAKIVLYILAGLLPLWFVPWPMDVGFGREITFGVLIIVAAILWLLSVLKQGEFQYQRSPVLFAGAGLFIVFSLSTIFSKAPFVSAIFADPSGERLSTMVLGLLLMALAGGVLKSRDEAGGVVAVMIFAGAVAGILSLLQIFGWSPYQLPVISSWLPFLGGTDFNAIGTINALAIFYAALLSVCAGLLLVTGNWSPVMRIALLVSSLIFLVNLIVINFQASWIVLLGSSVILFGLLFRNVRVPSARNKDQFGWKYWAVLVVLIFSVVMIMVRTPVVKGVNLPAEVSPSLSATLRVAFSVFKEGPKSVLLGSGPGTFGLDWARYKDPSINQTIFWGVRFGQGSSWLATLIPSAGILGFLAFLLFLGVSLITFLKKLLSSLDGETALPISILLGFTALGIAALFYPANFSLVLLLFLFAGLLTLLFGIGQSDEEGNKLISWDVNLRLIRLEAPTAVFISSLVIVFFIAMGIAGLYLAAGRVRAALAAQSGILALNRGALDESVERFLGAVEFENRNPRYHQMLVQARTEKIRSLIQRAAAGENVQAEFQNTVTLAIQNSQVAIELDREESALWRTQGALYELVIPFINGAERFAVSSYQKAAEFDPLNPAIYVDWGRAALAFADRVQFLGRQAGGQNFEQFNQMRSAALEEAEKALKKSVEVKPDYAPAHFLLTQTALRLGNTASAIQSAENAKLSAPLDIGIAFQLGLLYYQQNDLSRAEAEFLRAAALNPNYSNARYFLGLIYDRRGRDEEAIEEFEKVLSFNPDNEEVQKILSNLRKGKSALAGISPPGEAPEKRKETPVREKR